MSRILRQCCLNLSCSSTREEYIKALKALFREIVRILRYEINFVAFCRGLMQERNDNYLADIDQPTKVGIAAFFSILSSSFYIIIF